MEENFLNSELVSNFNKVNIESTVPNQIVKEGEVYTKPKIGPYDPSYRLYDRKTLISGHYMSSVFPLLCIYNQVSSGNTNLVIGKSDANSHTLEEIKKDSVNLENYKIDIEDYHMMLLTGSNLSSNLVFLINGYLHRNLNGDSWDIRNFDDGIPNKEVSSDINSKQSFIKLNIKLENKTESVSEIPAEKMKQIIRESLDSYDLLYKFYEKEFTGASKSEFQWILNQILRGIEGYDKRIAEIEDINNFIKIRFNSYVDIYRVKMGTKERKKDDSVNELEKFKPLTLDALGNLRLTENELVLVLTKEELESISKIKDLLKKYPDLVIGKREKFKADDSDERFSRGKFKFLLEGEDLKCSYDDYKSETQDSDKLREMLPVIKDLLDKLPDNFFICYGGFNFMFINRHNEVRMRFKYEVTDGDPKVTHDKLDWLKIKNY